MSKSFDTIVLGVGGVGSAVLSHLARRGRSVLGLDRFPPGHDRGSSHGQTRLIRQAYFEHADYVPLLKRAYTQWDELSQQCGKKLFHRVGVLQVGPREGRILPGVLASAQQHGLAVEELTPDQLVQRFPEFQVPGSLGAVFEQNAGYLCVEDCVLAQVDQAVKYGATLQTGETVLGWRDDAGGVRVQTDRDTYLANSLVIAAGAWARDLLSDLNIGLEVARKPVYWFAAPDSYDESQGTPGFIFETPAGNFYGFPRRGASGLKTAEHSGGDSVGDPLLVDRNEHPADTQLIKEFLRDYLPGVTDQQIGFSVCLYTLSPDRQFILDQHPQHPQVSFAAGLSGHGFKFVNVLGEALADLAEKRSTTLPVGFLNCRRPSLFASGAPVK